VKIGFLGHDDHSPLCIEWLPSRPSHHLLNLNSAVLLIPFGSSPVPLSRFDDHQSGRQVDSHRQSAGGAQNLYLQIEEQTFDDIPVLVRQPGIVECYSLRNHGLQGIVADLFGCLNEGKELLIILDKLPLSYLGYDLVARLLGSLLSGTKYQGSFGLTVAANCVQKFIVEYFLKGERIS